MIAVIGIGLGVLVLPTSPSAGQSAGPGPESGSSDWRQVSAGGDHTCGIRASGLLYCWGDNGDGEIGRNTVVPNYNTPVEVAGGHTDWTQVSAGDNHTCGRRANGRIYCWGDNGFGELGDGTTGTDRLAPTLVAGGFTNWTSVSAGFGHTCGRRANGRIYCWGRDGAGRLGQGAPEADRTTPTLVAGGFTNWTGVSAGGGHTCGRRANGRIYCWGDDSYGSLGNAPGVSDRRIPTLVAGGFTNWTAVDAGDFHTCGRRNTGRLYCWGHDFDGQVGDGGANTDRFVPVLLAGTGWASVSASEYHTCGRRSTGRIACWGENDSGQLGTGNNDDKTSPAALAGGATDWASVDSSGDHTCARTRVGRIYCWGRGIDGRLGNGDTGDQTRPTEVFVA